MLLVIVSGLAATGEEGIQPSEVVLTAPLDEREMKRLRIGVARPDLPVVDGGAPSGLEALSLRPGECIADIDDSQREALRHLQEERGSQLFVASPVEGGVLAWAWVPDQAELIRVSLFKQPAPVGPDHDIEATVLVVPAAGAPASGEVGLAKKDLEPLKRTSPVLVSAPQLEDLRAVVMAHPEQCNPDVSAAAMETLRTTAAGHTGEVYVAVEVPGLRHVKLYHWQPNAERLVALAR